MSEQRKTVAIIGAGIAGLTAALSLSLAANQAEQSLDIEIFEKAEVANEEGAGLQLSPNATHILQKLGLLDELLACAGQPQNIIMADGRTGQQIADIPLGDYAQARYGAPYIVVHRGDLHRILLAKATQQTNINIYFGHELANLVQQDAKYKCEFNYLGKAINKQADLYIAADGVWSQCKSQLGLDARNLAVYSGHMAWRGLVDDTQLVEKFQNSTHVWLGNKAHVVLYPISGGKQLNLVAFTEGVFKQKSWALDADISELKTHLTGWNEDIEALLDAAGQMKIWPLCAGAPEYQTAHDNILFIGDAAHPTLPYQAQGAAMAVEDAACLANLLYAGAEDWHHWADEILPLKLRVYEASRHDRVTKTQQTALQNARIFHLSAPISWARDLYLKFLSRFARKSLLSRLDWLYSKRYDNF
uniref:FAD-binding domain-containing protein n=1 Tax=OCS116 cluster bacterium TaxID=2030921 RepID=A0A2A4YTW8_9PROT